MTFQMILAAIIFVFAYILIATEVFNKFVTALVAAVSFILIGFVSQQKAFSHYVDWNVIFLLIGMMMMMGVVKNSGIFQFVAIWIAKKAKGSPIKILIMLFIVTGIFSAFLDNVTTIIIMTPISILIAVELGLSPIPFVLAQVFASNIGGTATLIGDPPNLMIGSAMNYTFLDFVVNLAGVITFIMILITFIIWFFFRKRLHVSNERRARLMEFDEKQAIQNKQDLVFGLSVIALFIFLFFIQEFTNYLPSTIALVCAGLLLVKARKMNVEEFLAKEIEWGTILFFIGLFIMVGALEEVGLISKFSEYMLSLTKGNFKLTGIIIVWSSGIASAFIDNIPFVATMIPLLKNMSVGFPGHDINGLWWGLSLGACLGGNGTLVGASANLVAVGILKKSGYNVSFMKFTKYGIVITLISLTVSTFYLLMFYL